MTDSQCVADIRLATACADILGDSVTTAKPARSSPKRVTTHSIVVGPSNATLESWVYPLD